jgi:chaperonin GroES
MNYKNMNQMQEPMDETNTQDINEDSGEIEKEEPPLAQLINAVNIAAELDEEDLEEISEECKAGFEQDLISREQWEKDLDDWTKLAMQVRENKSYPWPNASNVKYPLLSTAAMQFNARAYPSLIPSDGKVVKGKYIGKDLTGEKTQKAERVATYMSYQFMHEMDTWDEEMDKMLIMLPIVGTVFKKTYWCKPEEKIKSELVLPKNLVVNNWAKSIEDAERVSEIIEMSQRVFEERVRQGVFLDVDLGEPVIQNKENSIGHIDATTPYELIEQHTFLDLDEDGYKEPYVVTFYRPNGKIVRIAARFLPEDIEHNEDGEISSIKATQHYTKFSFVPNPDGSFYDVGFGVLLGPLNESVNTLINQLVDAGSLANLQSGFIGKGLRIRMGQERFQPGEWKPVASSGDDLKKQIVPLPAKDPSNVLFQLMGSLITSGKELASVAEIFVGKMPGQNTPATTTMATIEQGMKVFTAVYKRIYRSLDKEFKKVYDLNKAYLNPNTYAEVLDAPVGPDDFNTENYDICPGADPTAVSKTEQLMKAQGLMELLPTGALDPIEVISRILQAQEQPNWEKLFSKEVQQSGQIPQRPDPKMLELQMKSKADQAKFAMEQQKQAQDQALAERDQVFQHMMKQQEQNQNARHEQIMTAVNAASQLHMDQARVQGEQMKAAQQAAQSGQQHVQQMVQSAQTHQQKLQQMKEQTKLSNSQSKTGSTGKKTQ